MGIWFEIILLIEVGIIAIVNLMGVFPARRVG